MGPMAGRKPGPIPPAGEDIDRRYGLEPVFEPADRGEGLQDFAELDCPYCGEPLTLPLDLSAGSQTCTEDCHVCCQPMTVVVQVDADGRLRSIAARRGDD
jgi:hypothetical protein